MSSSPKAVFLSYASQDAEAARHIGDALQAMNVEVWFDQSALRGGDAWDASIRRQIKDCALFVPIISANTQAREEGYFRREWNLAVNRTLDMADGKAFLLPVVIDATIDVNARVPERFRDVQWTNLPGGEAAGRFCRARAAPAVGQRSAGSGYVGAPCCVSSSRGCRRSAKAGTAVDRGAALRQPQQQRRRRILLGRPRRRVAECAREDPRVAGGRALPQRSRSRARAQPSPRSGRALNVTTVLEGSVRKAGSRMRIAVQLVNVADGYHLWSETYDRTFDDIFAVQDDIAQSVVQELRTRLLGGAADAKASQEVTAQVAAAAKGRATDPEAHRLFLQARYLGQRTNRDDTAKAIGYLKQALERDPEFALAWTELGGAYSSEAGNGWTPFAEGYARARVAVARALALEPDLAEAHVQMGLIQVEAEWDWAGAAASCRRALELAPGNARVVNVAGTLAMNQGRLEEAIRLYRQALEQDPLGPAPYGNLANALHMAGRFAEAEAASRKALELAPQCASAHAKLALNLLAQGRGEEALAEAMQEKEEWARLWALAIIQHAAGRPAESEAALQALIAKYAAAAAYQVALVYAARGETDRAFDWLERAYDQRDPGLADMKPDRGFRSSHADPRWDVFLRKMGLAD